LILELVLGLVVLIVPLSVSFSGHSCRSGFLTRASEAGADVLKMSEVSRHKSLDVLRRYVRRSNLF